MQQHKEYRSILIIIGLMVGFIIGWFCNKNQIHICPPNYKEAYLNYIEKIDSNAFYIKEK